MTTPPPLPTQLSSDGREVWDWAARMSDHIHQQCRITELSGDIARVGRGCGDCQHWMTRQCPHETNVKGQPFGPSMNNPVCGRYIETLCATQRRAELRTELATLLCL